jgi:hypothetical protein
MRFYRNIFASLVLLAALLWAHAQTMAGLESPDEASPKTSDYRIAPTDCGNTIIGSSGPWTLTLPATTEFRATCVVQVCNGDPNDRTHHAIRLSGFPPASLPRLWMQQCEEVSIINGTWNVTKAPGKFRPTFTPTLYIDKDGNDSNDGLLSNAAGNALASVQQCFYIVKWEWDSQSLIPACSPTAGQVITGCPNYTGRDAGIIFLIGNGGNATLRSSCNVVVEEFDFGGYIIFSNITLDCTSAASHPCYGLFIHQQNGTDLSTAVPADNPVSFVGDNVTDVGIWCDAFCRINSSEPVVFSGRFKTLVAIDFGSNAHFDKGVKFSDNLRIAGNAFRVARGSTLMLQSTMTIGTAVALGANVFDVNDLSQLLLSGTFAVTGSLASGRQWSVLNNSLFCNDSPNGVPGTPGVNSAQGASNGTIAAATNGSNCVPSFP